MQWELAHRRRDATEATHVVVEGKVSTRDTAAQISAGPTVPGGVHTAEQ